MTSHDAHHSENVLFEIGTRLGHDHAQGSQRFRLHWEEHVRKSRQTILKGAERLAARDSVTVLGAGAAYNIPIEELARDFNVVRLVDIDRDGLERALSGVSSKLRSKVELHFADATAGLAVRLLDLGLEIIRCSGNPEAARPQLAHLVGSPEQGATTSPDQVESWKASYVISSGLSSQSTIFPEKALARAYQDRFGIELEEDFFLKSGSFHLRDAWVRRHGEFLASLVSGAGRVYWADTVAETPCLKEFGDGPLDAMVDCVVSFLERAYLRTFLTEKGTRALGESFEATSAFPAASSEEDRLKRGERILRSFKDRLDASGKRRLAWAIMIQVGENGIAPKKELELLEYIIREAERLNHRARRPILSGRLSTFFPSVLEPDGEMVSWMWINDPEAAVTLGGSTFYVDAQILKPK